MATSAFVILDNGFRTKDNNVSSINREEPGKPEGLKKTSAIGRPPRHLPDLRHCRSSNQLPTLSDFVCVIPPLICYVLVVH